MPWAVEVQACQPIQAPLHEPYQGFHTSTRRCCCRGRACQRAQAPELVLLQRLPGVVVLVLALEGRQVGRLLALLRIPAPAARGCC